MDMVRQQQTQNGETIYIYSEAEHEKSIKAIKMAEYIKKELNRDEFRWKRPTSRNRTQ